MILMEMSIPKKMISETIRDTGMINPISAGDLISRGRTAIFVDAFDKQRPKES